MEKIKLAMCDDVESLCKYFKTVFDMEEDIDFLWMAHNSKKCIELVKEKKPDILLLDVQMETNEAGILAIPKIKQISPETKIIILTIHEENDNIFKALTLGAIDYQSKTAPIDELFASIRSVYSNNSSLRPELAQKILSECENIKKKHESLLYTFNLMTKLSTSEFEVLNDLCDGYSYSEISKKRFVEESTVRSQKTRILKKFETNDMKTLIKTLNKLEVFKILENKQII